MRTCECGRRTLFDLCDYCWQEHVAATAERHADAMAARESDG